MCPYSFVSRHPPTPRQTARRMQTQMHVLASLCQHHWPMSAMASAQSVHRAQSCMDGGRAQNMDLCNFGVSRSDGRGPAADNCRGGCIGRPSTSSGSRHAPPTPVLCAPRAVEPASDRRWRASLAPVMQRQAQKTADECPSRFPPAIRQQCLSQGLSFSYRTHAELCPRATSGDVVPIAAHCRSVRTRRSESLAAAEHTHRTIKRTHRSTCISTCPC